jgi:HPt (histidine-containing phosphotransfer) domain-containing protein
MTQADDMLDLDAVRDLAGVEADSGRPFVRKLVECFADDARAALARMSARARAADAESVAREAHRLKGSGGSMGAAGFSAACLAIERLARAGECSRVEQGIEQARAVLDASRERMLQLFPAR